MLDIRLNRRPLSRSTRARSMFALVLITVSIAGFAAAQATFATLSGSIVDSMNGVLPEVTSSYDERDLSLYALGVGAAQNPLGNELQFVYERSGDGFQALPTGADDAAPKGRRDRARG